MTWEMVGRENSRDEAGDRAFDTCLLKAGLGLCVLSLMRERPRYAYELVGELRDRGLHLANGRSLYPALKNMERDGLLEAEGLVASTGGPARKYYRLTPEGEAVLRRRAAAFSGFALVVERILEGAGR